MKTLTAPVAIKPEFKFLITSLRRDPFILCIRASNEQEAKDKFWQEIERHGIDQGEWETNSYSYTIT